MAHLGAVPAWSSPAAFSISARKLTTPRSVGPSISRVRSWIRPWLSWMAASCSEMPLIPVKALALLCVAVDQVVVGPAAQWDVAVIDRRVDGRAGGVGRTLGLAQG